MAVILQSTITNAGVAAIASAVAGASFQISSVQVGSGTSSNPAAATALVSPQLTLTNLAIQNFNNGTMQVSALLDSVNVTSTFNLTEAGIWVSLAGGAPILYAYYAFQTPGDTIANTGGAGDEQITIILPAQITAIPTSSISVATPGQVFNSPSVTATLPIVATPTVNGSGITTNYNVALNGVSSGTPVLTNGNFAVNQSLGVGTFADNWKLQKTAGLTHVTATLIPYDNSFTPDAFFQTPPAWCRLTATANNSPGANDFCMATTAIEGSDFRTSYGNAVTISAIMRASSSGSAVILIQTGGTPTQYFAFVANLTTAPKRFFFTIPASAWPAASLFNIGQQNAVSVFLSVLASGGSNWSTTSFSTTGWSATQTAGSAFGKLQNSGGTVDIADVKWDVSPGIALPIFEPYGTTLFRCLRYQQEISFFGIAQNSTKCWGGVSFSPQFSAKPSASISQILDITNNTSLGGSIVGNDIAASGMQAIDLAGGASTGDIIEAIVVASNLLF